MSDPIKDMELVHRQLHCVKHMCDVVTAIADESIKMLPALLLREEFGHFMIKRIGSWTSFFMEQIGEMLNGMDAVSDDDRRWDETFKQASDRWSNLADELNGTPAISKAKGGRND